MTNESTNSSASGDDTIELQLTVQELQELSQAADAAEANPPAQLLLANVPAARPLRYWQRGSTAKIAGVSVVYICVAWVSALQLAGQSRPATATAVALKSPPVIRPQISANDVPTATVRVVNPFDRSEVFEFPAGTSAAESREKVAQILMARARERQSRWEHVRPKPSTRTASL